MSPLLLLLSLSADPPDFLCTYLILGMIPPLYIVLLRSMLKNLSNSLGKKLASLKGISRQIIGHGGGTARLGLRKSEQIGGFVLLYSVSSNSNSFQDPLLSRTDNPH